jgi:hypothetical protein
MPGRIASTQLSLKPGHSTSAQNRVGLISTVNRRGVRMPIGPTTPNALSVRGVMVRAVYSQSLIMKEIGKSTSKTYETARSRVVSRAIQRGLELRHVSQLLSTSR